jgi:hypothetical protein
VPSGSSEASTSQSLAFFPGRGYAFVPSNLQDPLSPPVTAPVRPTRHRLLLAMAMASILLATVLRLDVSLDTGVRGMLTADEAPLDVYITSRSSERLSEMATGEQIVSSPEVNEQLQTGLAPGKVSHEQEEADSADSPVDPQAARDWHALMERSAKASVDEDMRQEEARAAMWRQTRSVMFRPERDFSVVEEEPLLADIRFREPVGVLGLGVTIGSCFIGIPIAGVPVEQRSIAITLFVCRDDSG